MIKTIDKQQRESCLNSQFHKCNNVEKQKKKIEEMEGKKRRERNKHKLKKK